MMKRVLSYLNNRTGENTRLGFTLIEIMIAISILAILATIGMTTYNQAQMRGRDAKRKQDLRAIATSLELYYQKNRSFPDSYASCSGTNNWCYSNRTDPWIPGLDKKYINVLPTDPTQSSSANPWSNNTFGYGYWSPDTSSWGGTCPTITTSKQYYVLVTRLENQNDADTCQKKQYKNCVNDIFCNSTNNYPNQFFILTSD